MKETYAHRTVSAPASVSELLAVLEARFYANMQRHPSLDWAFVRERLEERPAALVSLAEMERTGGEPDAVELSIGENKASATDSADPIPKGPLLFADCSAETPALRRSLCYDREALESRKKFPPADSAVEAVARMGAELLDEAEYRALQTLGSFDLKTSSWIKTPAEVRALGGALFCDRRYGRTFTYHNGADSYYESRGFRAKLEV